MFLGYDVSRMDRVSLRLMQALTVLAVLAYLLVFLNKGLPLGHDILAHATYSKLFVYQLEQGQFPVRWTEWVYTGFGQPLFNFYQVGYYYLVFLINLFAGNLVLSMKLAVAGLVILGSLFSFLLGKRFGRIPALSASLVYILTPYLFLDIFIRNSFPELMAFTFLTGLVWSMERLLVSGKSIYLALSAFILGIAVVSHLPAALIFAPVLVAYLVFLFINARPRPLKNIFKVGLAGILGLGLASFYVWPAIFELEFIKIGRLTQGGFDFHKNFINWQNPFGFIGGYSSMWLELQTAPLFYLGILQWMVFLGSIFAVVKLRGSPLKRYVLFWQVIFVYILFFSSSLSEFVWESVKPLGFLQFPWRFFVLMPVTLAILASFLVGRLQAYLQQKIFLSLTGFCVLSGLLNLSFISFFDASYFNLPFSEWVKSDQTKGSVFFEPGYTPVSSKAFDNTLTSRWQISSDRLTSVKSRDFEYQFDVSAGKDAILTINTPYFPGWKAYVDGKSVQISSLAQVGFMSVEVSQGAKKVDFRFEDTLIRKAANRVSFGSFVILGAIFLLPATNLSFRNLKRLFLCFRRGSLKSRFKFHYFSNKKPFHDRFGINP